MKQKISKQLTYWLGVVSLGLVVGISIQFAKAWTEPAAPAPGGNVEGPVNLGPLTQVKGGAFGTGGDEPASYGQTYLRRWGLHNPTGWMYLEPAVNGRFYIMPDDASENLTTSIHGNVGIGTDDPNYKLDVDGIINSSSGGYGDAGAIRMGYHTLSSHSNGWMYMGDQNGNVYGGRGLAVADIWANRQICLAADCRTVWPSGLGGSGTTDQLAKFTNGTTLGNSQIFDNSARVGIRNSNPQFPVDIMGSTRVVGDFYVESGNFHANGRSAFNGNVGIGKASGTETLEVGGRIVASDVYIENSGKWVSEIMAGAQVLYNGNHTAAQCVAMNGLVVGNRCKVAGATCPGGWTKLQNWTTTVSVTAPNGSEAGCPSNSCTTGSHAFDNIARESCVSVGAYSWTWINDGNDYVCTNNSGGNVINATITETGCY